jgi:hypothetical protein
MTQKYLILIDEQSQSSTLERMKTTLKNDEIDLVYEEYNPIKFTKRENADDKIFDKGTFIETLKALPYFNQIDSIACDYNLIEGVINGFDIIKTIKEINPKYKKQIILYSAKIEDVIGKIITTGDFDSQKNNLKQFIDCNIDCIPRNGYDQKVIKHIKQEKPFSIEDELIKWFYSRKEDEFNYLFPKYQGKKFEDIAKCIEVDTPESREFKKELVEQIIAYLSRINELS